MDRPLNFSGGNSGTQLGHNSGTVTNNYHFTRPPPRPRSPVLQPGEREDFCPFRRNVDEYVPRRDILDQLQAVLQKDASRAALVGLTGSGKTEVAIQFAHSSNAKKIWVFWIEGTTWKTVMRDFKRIAEQVQIPDCHLLSESRRITAVSRWLSTVPKGPWLVIIDGINDEAALSGPLGESGGGGSLIHLLPQPRRGRVLATTQNAAVARKLTGSSSSLISVGRMTWAEATELFELRASIKDVLETPFCNDVEDYQYFDQLDNLATTISRAGSYIGKQVRQGIISNDNDPMDLGSKLLMQEEDDNEMRRYHSAPKSSWLSVKHTLDRVFAARDSAFEILCLICLYGQRLSTQVPICMIQPSTASDIHRWAFEPLGSFLWKADTRYAPFSNPHTFEGDLDCLVDNCLIERKGSEMIQVTYDVVRRATQDVLVELEQVTELWHILFLRVAYGLTERNPNFIYPYWVESDMVKHIYKGGNGDLRCSPAILGRGALMVVIFLLAYKDGKRSYIENQITIRMRNKEAQRLEYIALVADMRRNWPSSGYPAGQMQPIINEGFDALEKAIQDSDQPMRDDKAEGSDPFIDCS